jgi:hypothetical protein
VKRNAKFCFDAFTWLAWLQDEPGAAAVQHCLDEADQGDADCITSIIDLGEAFYRLVRVDRHEQIAYADAFAVGTALEFQATLLTGDPEIKPLVGRYDLKVEWLPQRRGSRQQDHLRFDRREPRVMAPLDANRL